MENNDISSVEIMSLPKRYWFYKANSLPQIGKLFKLMMISFYSGQAGYPEGVDGLFRYCWRIIQSANPGKPIRMQELNVRNEIYG